MNPDTIDLLKALTEKFGVTVDYLWPLLVQYTRWMNIGWLAFNAVLVLAGVVGIVVAIPVFVKNFRLYNNRGDSEYTNYMIHGMMCIFTGLAVVAALAFMFVNLSAMPGHVAAIVVPEAQAIYDLLAQIKAK